MAKKHDIRDVVKKIKQIQEKDMIKIGKDIFRVDEKYASNQTIYLEDHKRGVLRYNKKKKKLGSWMLN